MAKERVIRLRCTQAEYEAWSKIAAEANVSLSELMRASLNAGPSPTRSVEQPVATKRTVATTPVATPRKSPKALPAFPEGHLAKCACKKCNETRGWR